MGIMELASWKSQWRGHEYFAQGKVLGMKKLSETEYFGIVQGSGEAMYTVRIDLAHPRKSECNCPLAEGKRIVCKHKVALFLAAFPEEDEKFLRSVEEAEREAEEWQEELDRRVRWRISTMKKAELQQALFDVLYSSPEWVFDHFVRDYVDE